MARVLIIILVVALSIYALIDLARTNSNSLPARLSKPVWLLLVLLVPVIGPGIWLYFKYQDVLSSDATFGSSDLRDRFNNSSRSKRSKGPVAPDDDPEFLARLDAQNRRRAWEAQRREEEGLDPLEEEDESKDGKNEEDEGPAGLYGGR